MMITWKIKTMAEFLLFTFELGTLIIGYLFFKFIYGL